MGRTENQLNELRKHVVDGTSNASTSIIEVLELWQQIFRETFQQYYRLSTRLVQNEDTASALKVWHDYLIQVQMFLSEALPDDYSSLNEYRHLCEVHQNVLTSQKSILSLRTDRGTSNVDPTLIDRFTTLSNLHNETLLRIIDRHAEIELRIKLWNKYKNDQTHLLDWLKEKEREKSRLQLRYIHLQRIPHTLQTIDNMLVQMKQAERECADLQAQQTKLMEFSNDSAIVTSMRIENNAIAQRIQNLRASLESWKDFLTRILNLSTTYNLKVSALQSQFQQVQNVIGNISKEMPQSIHRVENVLSELRAQRILLNNLTPELESVTVIHEELKECLSPSNIKAIRRTNFVLWQQQSDLDQQLTYLVNQIDERLSMNDLFNMKYDRFIQWIDAIENRLDNDAYSVFNDSEEYLRRVEKDLQSEINLREREKEW